MKYTLISKYLPLLYLIILCSHSALLYCQIEVSFSETRGYIDNPFSLTLTANDAGAQIIYTIDNSKPSSSNGTIYSGPFMVAQTTAVRAIAINQPDSSAVMTHSYIFLDEVINNSGLESYIINDPVYGPQMTASFESLPVISIVSSEIATYTVDIEDELEISTEMFWPDNSRNGFMLHNGVQTWGGSPTNPKKNYRLEFKAEYGAKKLEYDVFKADNYDATEYKIEPTDEFDKLLLRAGSQDGLNGEFGKESLALFVRNRVMMDVQIEMGYPSAHGRFVHLFVNGAYAGQYHLMERADASFFESYFGGDKEDYEVYKSGLIWDGPFDLPQSLWQNLDDHIDMSSRTAIQNTNRHIDLEQSAAYLLLMSYSSGQDWGIDRNCIGGGDITLANGGYRFILHDVDFSLGNGGIFDPFGASDLTYFNSIPINSGPVPSILTGSLEYRYIVADKMQCECYADGVLTPHIMDSLFIRRINQVQKSLIAESARWGDYNFEFPPNHIATDNWDVNDEFTIETNDVRNNYLPLRTSELIEHFKMTDVASELESVIYNQDGGLFSSSVELELNNPNSNSEIYYTTNGVDPREVGGGISVDAILYSGPIQLIEGSYTVKARVRNNSLNDNSIDKWSAMCPKKYYIDQNYSDLVINEIHYNPEDSIMYDGMNNPIDTIDGSSFEFIEIKNIGPDIVNLEDISIAGGIDIVIDQPFLLNPASFVVYAEDTTWFNLKYGFEANGQYQGKLSNSGEIVFIEDPVGNVVDSVDYDDNNGWPMTADNGKYSLALKESSLDNSLPENWGIQPNFFTPLADNFFTDLGAHLYSGIVINEMHYHPPDTLDALGETIDGNLFEFIELKNISPISIDLSGVYFSDGINYTFPDGTIINDNEFIVLGKDSTLFFDRYGFHPYGEYTGSLSNGGETIELSDVDDVILDIVTYDDKLPWDTLADGTMANLSLALLRPNIDNDVASNWKTQCSTKSTPAMENDIVCHVCTTMIEDLTMSNIIEDIEAEISIKVNGQIMSPNAVIFRAGETIDLAPVFDVENGGRLELIIGPCD